jgi:ABC-type bacteriocin/lantibiotic exporter with double-glycine peptidase domain
MFKTSTFNTRTLKQLKDFFRNRWALACFFLLTIQQLIVASSTVWLVTMMTKMTAGEPFLPFLYLYLFFLITPYIPECLANVAKINWKQEAQRSFINAFVSSNRNQIGEWSNKKIKEEKLSILTTEGPNAINAFVDYAFDFIWYILSVLFNITAVSIIVEPLFALAYGLSVIMVLTVMKLKRRTQRQLTRKALAARIDLCQSLLAAWDNVLLGNAYNFALWEDKTTQRLNRCLQRNVALERFDQLLAIMVSLITAVPSLMVVVYYAHINRFTLDKLLPFLIVLPLLFLILSYTYQTLSLMFRWAMHRSKLSTIYKAIEPITDCQASMEKKIKWPKININSSNLSTVASPDHISVPGPTGITDCQSLLLETQSFGRLTLRGENGAGKSTLLMLVKTALSEKAFFLPTQNQLSFMSETNKHSTGESLKNRLMEILEQVQADVLLLDEWDANLDHENQERLSGLIDELAKKKCVIEVRHR